MSIWDDFFGGDNAYDFGDLEETLRSTPDAYDFGDVEEALRNANARDFLRGMAEETAVSGPGVFGTGIPTGGTSGIGGAKDFFKSIIDYAKNNKGKVGTMAVLAALGALSKAPPSGGGTTKAYRGPAQQLTRTVTQGKYGPIAQYAAQGGIMHAYANGGQVRPFPMQDGGFVLTKRAVDGAGGQGGLRSILPEAQPIQGPGTGTSDSIPAYIQGENGRTPAKLSNGEAYVPPGRNTREMYALMKYLEGMERRA